LQNTKYDIQATQTLNSIYTVIKRVVYIVDFCLELSLTGIKKIQFVSLFSQKRYEKFNEVSNCILCDQVKVKVFGIAGVMKIT